MIINCSKSLSHNFFELSINNIQKNNLTGHYFIITKYFSDVFRLLNYINWLNQARPTIDGLALTLHRLIFFQIYPKISSYFPLTYRRGAHWKFFLRSLLVLKLKLVSSEILSKPPIYIYCLKDTRSSIKMH